IDQGLPLRRIRDEDAKVLAARGKPELFEAFRKAGARRWRGNVAPEANVRAIENAVHLPIDKGLDEERHLSIRRLRREQSRAQQYYFFAERNVQKVPDVPEDTPTLPVEKVGIVGAGTMGGGIAMNFANVGVPVTLVEVKQEALDRGLGVIRANYERTA